MGFINIEQNRIIKNLLGGFRGALPPTLVASSYVGLNSSLRRN